MTDKFNNLVGGLESPAVCLLAVEPSDTQDLAVASRGINVATSGSVRVTTIGGSTATVYVAAGGAFPLRVRRIWQSGTTASGIVVMY
ncbi:spike base protein, RCAP_Rcc01079 family [Rhodovulum sp.]|uniref:spike base protein, RCAP_Rcc01079 family n=1 Tax=Rhodovulum sp. TaxID=34009 RepID=UPI00183D9BF6|nr:hypothetical protein [Rhodovulum sp.]HDR28350.1 hypothetical protein [Rhodovulum sp.]